MEVHSISRFKLQSVAILAPLISLSYSLFFVIYFLNRFHRDGPFAVSMCKIGAHYNSCSFSIMVKGAIRIVVYSTPWWLIGLMYSEKLAFIITVNFRFGDHDTLLLQTPQH